MTGDRFSHSEAAGWQLDRRGLLAGVAVVGAEVFTGVAPATAATMSAKATARSPLRGALIAALADTIIPPSDTLGAVAAGVPQFIEMMIEKWFSPAEKERFLGGLDRFDTSVRAVSGRSFVAMSPLDRLRTLTAMAQAERDRSRTTPFTDGPFIAQMRALTVFGYYTSEPGASQELNLNLVPGEYDPCHKIAPGEHAHSVGSSNAVLRLP